MKLIICGKSFIACKSLNYLVDIVKIGLANVQLYAVSTANDSGVDTWEPSFIKTAKKNKVPVFQKYYDLSLTRDDIIISLQYDRLIKTNRLCGAKAFNIHFSNLPKYRGCHTSIWPIRNSEPDAGVTLHLITDGIDDGAIIDQKVFSIPSFLTSYDLYQLFNHYGYELLKKNIRDILQCSYRAVAQGSIDSSYYSRKSVDYSLTEVLDFQMSCVKVRDYIRSMIFDPYQFPIFKGKQILSCDLVLWPLTDDQLRKMPFIIINDTDHAIVRCLDGLIRLNYRI